MFSSLKENASLAALTVAVLALFVALGGIAGALPGKKSVDKNDLKKNAVASKNVAPDTLTGGDIKESTLELPAALKTTYGVKVNAGGGVISSTLPGVTAARVFPTGAYGVTFPKNISDCVAVASPAFSGGAHQIGVTQPSNALPNAVGVFTENSAGTATDADFGLLVTC
jgi:hypothetical protein